MLSAIGAASRRALIEAIVPRAIARAAPMRLPAPLTEAAGAGRAAARIAAQNQVLKSFIGQGYHGTHTPGVILRNVLENPAWYTAYTPYQAEISQGRMEALVNFQTMVTDLTGMAIANASMLDEATAAAEAMTLALRVRQEQERRPSSSPTTCCRRRSRWCARAPRRSASRSWPARAERRGRADCFARAAAVPRRQRRGARPEAADRRGARASGGLAIVAADLLALTLLVPPGEMGADIVVGNTQRFGMPMGNGGPHAAYLATKDEFKRSMPGPAGRRQRRRARRAGLPPRAADARAAHPAREGDLATSARRRCCRRWSRACTPSTTGPQGLKRIAAARRQLHRGARRRAARSWAARWCTTTPSTRSRSRTGDRHRRRARRPRVAAGMNLRRASATQRRHHARRDDHARRHRRAVGACSRAPARPLPDVRPTSRKASRR